MATFAFLLLFFMLCLASMFPRCTHRPMPSVIRLLDKDIHKITIYEKLFIVFALAFALEEYTASQVGSYSPELPTTDQASTGARLADIHGQCMYYIHNRQSQLNILMAQMWNVFDVSATNVVLGCSSCSYRPLSSSSGLYILFSGSKG